LRPKLWIGGEDVAVVLTSQVTSDSAVVRIVLNRRGVAAV